MKFFKIKIFFVFGLLFLSSCEEYLDIAPQAVLTEEEVFSSFDGTQGFVEEMYALMVNPGTQNHTFSEHLLGDEIFENASFKFSARVDRGELDNWINNTLSFLGRGTRFGSNRPFGDTSNNNGRAQPKVWLGSLSGIRKANIVIKNEDLMVGLSQEEKNVALGQAYFFRAYFHNQIMKYWGRFPYINEVLEGVIEIPRPATYKEVALLADEDYKKAIQLLPDNWDNEPYGQLTIGNNANRLTKSIAYAYKGKNLLLAASPLMFFNNAPGIDPYTYDKELAAMAVDDFAEVLKLDGSTYSFAQNMEDYTKVLWNTPQNTMPGLVPEAREFIFTANGASNPFQSNSFMSHGIPRDIAGGGTQCASVTHSFINNNFGMANGLSIEDDLSGVYGPPTYNPLRPFDNRDPRYYEWIFSDRDVIGTRASIPAVHRSLAMYFTDNAGNPGQHRRQNNSKTGYLYKKFYPKNDNGEYHTNVGNRILGQYRGMLLSMRLTDVYLMYAEALHVSRGATSAPNSFNLTAEQVINKIRTRAGIPNINPAIVADSKKFMDELRRERAVELSFESHRWLDIRRWGVAHLPKYKRKTELRYDKDWTFFEEVLLTERVCEYPKHYWLPFQVNQTQFYEGFPQNPGW
ncbi:RagB/SusD family nutrient uptake outer membrane protein [Polaribacter septentrionalilitoris]|uniref:RagB/SusD family nutrient uptake outer membrane protein n=1 Tax=Polaribacter septentrionalilitoris TaxID=2494657 RepID=UPI00135C2CAA|nr:RagB/SusD family nutrient uptake outer membrane protein [Polaribacter septentrionalilitoris]